MARGLDGRQTFRVTHPNVFADHFAGLIWIHIGAVTNHTTMEINIQIFDDARGKTSAKKRNGGTMVAISANIEIVFAIFFMLCLPSHLRRGL